MMVRSLTSEAASAFRICSGAPTRPNPPTMTRLPLGTRAATSPRCIFFPWYGTYEDRWRRHFTGARVALPARIRDPAPVDLEDLREECVVGEHGVHALHSVHDLGHSQVGDQTGQRHGPLAVEPVLLNHQVEHAVDRHIGCSVEVFVETK